MADFNDRDNIEPDMEKKSKPKTPPTIDVNFEKIKKNAKRVLAIVFIPLILIVAGLNSFFILENKENGVILRFGQLQSVVTKPGINFKVPFIDTVTKVDVRTIYNMEYGFRSREKRENSSIAEYEDQDAEAKVIVDGANNNASIALIELIIQYRIKDPVDYLYKVDDVVGTLNLALEDIVRTSLQSFTLDEAKTQKELIDESIKPRLQKKIDDYQIGIEIVLVGTQNVQFLPSVEEAYQQKENANQYKNGKKEDAEKYYNTIIPKANAEARKLIEDANAYRAETVAKANADVAQFNALYEQYKENPEVVKERYYLESMMKLFKSNQIVITGAKDDNLHKFYNFTENAAKNDVILGGNAK